jgi:hypothetical protein
MNRNWIAPACGALFVVLAVVAFVLTGGGQDPAKKTAEEVANYYSENDTKQLIGAGVVALAVVPLLFFAGWMRRMLRDVEGPGGMLSAVAFGALVVLAVGLTVGATIHFALADYADSSKLDPVALSAINTIDYDFFVPFPIAMSAFMLSVGITTVRNGGLPRWLAWAAVVIGIASLLGPVGFFAFILGLAWILVVGLLGAIRGGAPTAPPATT